MILHILGGGPGQISAINCVKEKGYEVLVSDLNPSAPGFLSADFKSYASTFDEEAVLADAVKYGSSFLMTTGTDQPVLTAARVSSRLGLSYFLTPQQALVVTNKKIMKNAFRNNNIPTMKFVILRDNFHDEELQQLQFPLVIKPLDSQGQRGVLKVYSISDIRDNIKKVLSFSREKEILAEEYYESRELTVSGWVQKGKTNILLITDRVTIDNGPHLGVCVSHRYPSLFHHKKKELSELVSRITSMIGLDSGPVYYQILMGDKGFQVNEIACRLGGAYEDEFIPDMTGVPLLDLMVDLTTGKNFTPLSQTDIHEKLSGKYLSLQMFFAKKGVISHQGGMERVLSMEGILNGKFLLKIGTKIVSRENSTQRAGYFIVTGSSPEEVNDRIKIAYDHLILEDESGQSMIQFYNRMMFPL